MTKELTKKMSEKSSSKNKGADPNSLDWGFMKYHDKSLLKDWIANHDQAAQDCVSHYNVKEIDDLTDYEVWSWIAEHDQACDDLERYVEAKVHSEVDEESTPPP